MIKKSITKVLRGEIILPALLFVVTFIFWRHIPSLQFIGEGYYYFADYTVRHNILERIDHEMFARWVFSVLPQWFGSYVHLYMWFLLIYLLMTNLAIYIAFRVVIQSKVAAFIIALLFSTSYVGQFDMYSAGGYQYFVQRGAVLLPVLLSFMFLVLYLTQGFKIRYYIFSLMFYILGIVMGFFGTWFLATFVFYPLFFFLFNLKIVRKLFIANRENLGSDPEDEAMVFHTESVKDAIRYEAEDTTAVKPWSFIRLVVTPLPFLIINILLIRQSDFIPEETLFEFIFNRFGYVTAGIFQQLAVVTPFLEDLLRNYNKDSLMFQGVLMLTPLLYLGAFFAIKKLGWQSQALAATALMSLLTMLLFNVYLNSANTLNTLGSSRYFYFPFTMVAIFWGLFLTSLLIHRKTLITVLVVTFFLIWIVYNNNAIKKNLKADEWLHNVHRVSIEHLRSWSENLKDKPSYVYHPLGPYGSAFALRFFSHPEGKFIVQGLEELDLEGLAKQGVSPERLYVLSVDTRLQVVFDKTEESREILRSLEERDDKL